MTVVQLFGNGEPPADKSLKSRLQDAKLAGTREPKDEGSYFHYSFRSNEQAAMVALEEVELWLRDLAKAEEEKAESTRSITRKRALKSAAERYHLLADGIYQTRGD